MRFVYATDLHGNRDAIEQVFKLARDEQVDAIVFGGDLTPKLVAIKLAQYPDHSDETLLLGGEILPTDMLQKDILQSTFSHSLRNIKLLNEKAGAGVLGKYLERKGALIANQTNQYYDFNSMFAEQILLDKLLVFFREAQLPNAHIHLQLSNDEMDMVRDCVVEWFKKLEATWSGQKRIEFVKKCAFLFKIQQDDFEQLAPSEYIEKCILCETSGIEVFNTLKEIEKILCGKKDQFSKYLQGIFSLERNLFLRALSYKNLIEKGHIAALVEYSTIAQLKRKAEDSSCIRQGQANFIQEYFLPLAREWKSSHGNMPVYVLLGNDDNIENVLLLDRAEQEGLLSYIHNKVHKFSDDFVIAGYSFVETLPEKVEYRAWVKDDSEILSDLRRLQSQVGQSSAIWVIHNPPFGYLDQTKEENAGSKGVLQFITETQPRLALFGHIHEAPRLAGTCIAQLGKTLCVNPGGEHDENFQAVIINTETLEIIKKGGG